MEAAAFALLSFRFPYELPDSNSSTRSTSETNMERKEKKSTVRDVSEIIALVKKRSKEKMEIERRLQQQSDIARAERNTSKKSGGYVTGREILQKVRKRDGTIDENLFKLSKKKTKQLKENVNSMDQKEHFQKVILSLPKTLQERGSLPFMTPLTAVEKSRLWKAFVLNGDVASFPCERIRPNSSSFSKLQGDNWLDDELVNSFVSMVNARNRGILRLLPQDRRDGIPNCLVFNRFFFTKLEKCIAHERNQDGIGRWTEGKRLRVLEYHILLFPVNVNMHWVLGGLDIKNQEVFVLDSLGSQNEPIASKLREWFQVEVAEKYGLSKANSMKISEWRILYNSIRVPRVHVVKTSTARNAYSSTPKQTDGSSCGVFMLYFLDCVSLGIDTYFSQDNILLMRQRLGINILNQYLPV